MVAIRVSDISHVRFTAPDLEEMRAFLVEFGLTPTMGPDGVLYARGAGPSPFLHSTAKGEPGFAALGLRAESLSDLEILARAEGVVVEAFDAPGGGSVVRLNDPDGRLVEVIAGQTPVDVQPMEPETPRNSAASGHPRVCASVRLTAGPATVVRLGHCVLEVSDFRTVEAWYKSRFGFITSDEIEAAPGAAIGAFLRCDRGDTPTDHHTLFLLQSPRGPGFNHAAFEVADMDDLMRGHDHLKAGGRKAAWGIGRHILGSQIFDYWKDPWGHELEHWTDGDLFTVADGSNTTTLGDLLGVQWGSPHPMMAGAAGGRS
jgi:catechol 2,3-dioxygenase-like lactoylglutathione lyase family enzyme